MIPVVEIVRSMRLKLDDMQGTKISDYDLIEAINKAVAQLYGHLSDRYVHASLKSHVFNVGSTGSTALPVDFIRVYQVFDSDGNLLTPTTGKANFDGVYRIMNNTFFGQTGSYNLEYYYTPIRISGLNDNLDVPNSMRPYIEELSECKYKKDFQAEQMILEKISHVLAGNEIAHFPDAMVSNVLGGNA